MQIFLSTDTFHKVKREKTTLVYDRGENHRENPSKPATYTSVPSGDAKNRTLATD